MSKYYVYILKSINFEKTYIGFTDNLERRLTQHNKGYNVFSKRFMPWKIIYTEIYNTQVNALEREKYLKSAAGRRWMKKYLFS